MKLFFLTLPILLSLILSINMLGNLKYKFISLKILGLFFLFFCLALTAILFQYLQEFYPSISRYFHLIEIVFYFIMLSMPAIVYFYIISLTDSFSEFKSIKNIAPHLFIPIQSLLFNIYPYIFENSSKNEFLNTTIDYTNFFSLKIIFVLLNFYYLSLAIATYKKHRTKIKHILSYNIGISFNWILVFLLGYIVFVACFFLLNPNSSPYVIYLPLILLCTFYFFQKDTQKMVSLENTFPNEKQNKNNSPLTDSKRELIKNELLSILENEKLYLKKELTIYDVAKELNTNNTYISNIINTTLQSNFTSLINSYRIEEAKRILMSEDYSNYTIEAISSLVGFNSKSAFNNAFKNKVGITPTDFVKQNKLKLK